MEWYTKDEVAEKLGISTATVYQYARQGKIKKIEDPHRLHRVARYKRKEVDALASIRELQRPPSGIRPSELAKQLKIPVKRIYTLLKEHQLPVDEFQIGAERFGYMISDSVVAKLKEIVAKTMSTRGTPTEFYNSYDDIALFQRFVSKSGRELRLLRNEKQEWGFYLQGQTWLPYNTAREEYGATAAYEIHQPNVRPDGYIDFILPKESFITYDFIDFAYRIWGVENIRLRELDKDIALSIKSGEWNVESPLPDSMSMQWLTDHTAAGSIEQQGDTWHLLSGHRKTTIQLPETLLAEVVRIAKQEGKTMSEYIEEAVQSKVNKDYQN